MNNIVLLVAASTHPLHRAVLGLGPLSLAGVKTSARLPVCYEVSCTFTLLLQFLLPSTSLPPNGLHTHPAALGRLAAARLGK